MNVKDYDTVVEVSLREKEPWVKKWLDFSMEDIDFMTKLANKEKKYFICNKGDEIFLIDSDGSSREIENFNIDNFDEIEIDSNVYCKYRVLK